jgi:hypothetical protein
MWYGGPDRADGVSDPAHGSGGLGNGARGSKVVAGRSIAGL